MTNFIIISDLHIDIFDGRLPKYLELSDILVNKCLEYGAKELIIAGDVINNSVTSPKVIHTLKEMLENLNSHSIKVSYILGQHDFNLRNINGDLTNTYLGLLNMEYIGGTHRNVEGVDIYFKDYERTNCVEPDECDILIGHISLGFQDIDQSKIKYLGICGDIHKRVQIGKCFSICPPMQVHQFEEEDGFCVELSIDNGKIANCRRVTLPRILTLPKPERLKVYEDIQAVEVEGIESYTIPDSIVKDLDLSNAPKPINMNFRIVELEIENYKAIKHRVLKFDDNKIVFLQGGNGSSKTTTLDALYFAFVKARGQEYSKLRVTFEYQGSLWVIQRGNECKILKDGMEVPFKSKSEFEEMIVELFPFTTMLRYFYVKTYSRFFECNRVELFEELFNLKEYAYVLTQCKSLVKSYSKTIDDIKLKLAKTQGQIEAYEKEIKEIDIDRDAVLEEYTKLKEWSDKLNTLRGMKTASETTLTRLKSRVDIPVMDKDELLEDQQLRIKRDSLARQISRIKNSIIVCPTCGTKINASNVDELEAELNSLPEPKYENSFIMTNLSLIESREKDMKDIISQESELQRIVDRITELEGRLEGKDMNDLLKQVNDYDSNESMKLKLQALLPMVDQYTSEIKVYETKIEDTETLIAQVDIKNPTSIPVKKLEKLVQLIETDDIKLSILSQYKNGNDKLDIQMLYRGIPYDELSSGERCLLDLQLILCITKTLGIVGIVILDEALAGLDALNYEIAGELLCEFSTYNVLITSHQIGFNKYDRIIELHSGDDTLMDI